MVQAGWGEGEGEGDGYGDGYGQERKVARTGPPLPPFRASRIGFSRLQQQQPGMQQEYSQQYAVAEPVPVVQQAPPEAQLSYRRSTPVVLWLRLTKGSSLVNDRGLPWVAPALAHTQDLAGPLAASSAMLQDLLGDESLVETTHDCDWSQFPDVGAALRHAGAEEQCLCVAVCASRALWGVGLAGKWKNRETSAKLALCVALAWHADSFPELAERWPELGALCEAAGYKHSDARSANATALALEKKRKETAAQSQLQIMQAPALTMSAPEFPLAGAPLWIHLPEDQPKPQYLEAYPREAPALYHTTDPNFQSILSNARNMLIGFIGENAQVEIYDDAGWDMFPQVGNALRRAGGQEQCLCIAVCPEHGKWGVGLAGRKKLRESVARLALCVAIAPNSPSFSSMVANYPEFGDFCASQAAQAAVPAAPTFAPAGQPQNCMSWGRGSDEVVRSEQPVITDGTSQGTLWIQLTESMPFLLRELCHDAPCVCISWDVKFQSLQSCAHGLLGDLVGDLASQVQFHHDCDWSIFPQIGKALVHAGAGEQSVCVAICPELGKWAVGLGGKWKTRESAAKLALCIAVGPSTLNYNLITAQWPEFGAICQEAGAEATGNQRIWKRELPVHDVHMAPKIEQREIPTPPPSRQWQVQWSAPPVREAPPPVVDERLLSPMPRDTPLWVSLPEDEQLPTILENCPRETLVLATDGAALQTCYTNADLVVAHLVGNAERDVDYIDDPGREKFPRVSAALKRIGERPEPIGIALCSSRDVWGIGVGTNEVCRYQAAKVALASMLILQAEELGEDADLSGFSEMAEFVEEARKSRMAANEPSVEAGGMAADGWQEVGANGTTEKALYPNHGVVDAVATKGAVDPSMVGGLPPVGGDVGNAALGQANLWNTFVGACDPAATVPILPDGTMQFPVQTGVPPQ